ncbi:MAG: mannitol dehydrogenase family protein [Eubacteriales bacterium]
MKLNLKSIQQKKQWEDIDVSLPTFDIEKLRSETHSSPEWLHFGGGNIFRVFIANALHEAIEKNKVKNGVIVAESFDFEMVDKYYHEYDNLSLSVIMDPKDSYHKKIVASITEALKCIKDTEDWNRLYEIAQNESLKMISFTITEKGYALKDMNGNYLSVIEKDIADGPDNPLHTMSIVASLLYSRYRNGAYPVAVVSMDNCSHNGDKLGNAVKEISQKWHEKGYVEEDFIEYINSDNVSFPYTMIDKITPRPSENVKNKLENLGIEDMDLIITQKGSYTAPFVNSEVCEYLIIEDDFPNGKIDISSERVIFTDRDTVNNVETMKVTTCLNPLHTALAVTGCLMGYTLIANQMKNPILVNLIKKIGYDEGLKVVVDPKIINPKDFIDEVVNERLTNPNIPDTPQRIAMDTSQKVGIRFGHTIKAYMADEHLDSSSLVGIPLAIAAWCRYLVGIDDNGAPFELSSDPLKDALTKQFEGIQIGSSVSLKPMLSNNEIFGVDLYTAGLGDKIQTYFDEMMAKKGGVEKTIEKYCK